MNADGSGQTDLTNDPADDTDPTWSPDGSKIAFTTNRGPTGDNEIYLMNANGSSPVDLTNSPANESDPDWQPVPGTPPAAPDQRLCRIPNLSARAQPGAREGPQGGLRLRRRQVRPLEAPAGPRRPADAAQGPALCLGVRLNVVLSRGLR